MDSEKIDHMSSLLAIGEGGQAFFVTCLLHLSPEDLKACRLVNKTWSQLIKERVWGNKRARKRLEEKLVQRWNTTNPETVQLGTVHRGVEDIFCNNEQVFCMNYISEVVKVHSLTDGQWIRDLDSGVGNLKIQRICGGESIVAAQWGHWVVRVWCSKEEMGQLHSFDARIHDDLENCRVQSVEATGNKVILLLEGTDSKHPGSTYQLVVLQEGEQDWETKILETFTTPEWGKLAVDRDWLAVVGKDKFRPNILKVKLWKKELFRQDIELLGVPTNFVGDVVLESPFLIIGGRTRSLTGWIKVVQSYLLFVIFLQEQNFWRIKFTPKKRVNYDKIHSKLPIFALLRQNTQ